MNRRFLAVPMALSVFFLGCGMGQKIVSATALAAVAADDATSGAFEMQADATAQRLADQGGTFGEWCSAMMPVWSVYGKIGCAVQALGDLAMAGQNVLDAGSELGPEWIGGACSVLRAVADAWTIAEPVPEVLTQAVKLVCGFAGTTVPAWETCEPGPVPGCDDGSE